MSKAATVDAPPIAYSVKDAATLVGLSERSLADEIRSGNLVARHFGAKKLIGRDELLAWFHALPTERTAS